MVRTGTPIPTYRYGLGDTPQAARAISIVRVLTATAKAHYDHAAYSPVTIAIASRAGRSL